MFNRVEHKGYTAAMFDRHLHVYDSKDKLIFDAELAQEMTEEGLADYLEDFVRIAESGD